MRTELAEDAFAVFADAGMDAGDGLYTSADGSSVTTVRVFRQQRFASIGSYQQLPVGAVAFGFFLAEVTPEADGVLQFDGATWRCSEEIDNDGCITTWAVRRG